jgi:hypothetical protein
MPWIPCAPVSPVGPVAPVGPVTPADDPMMLPRQLKNTPVVVLVAISSGFDTSPAALGSVAVKTGNTPLRP